MFRGVLEASTHALCGEGFERSSRPGESYWTCTYGFRVQATLVA